MRTDILGRCILLVFVATSHASADTIVKNIESVGFFGGGPADLYGTFSYDEASSEDGFIVESELIDWSFSFIQFSLPHATFTPADSFFTSSFIFDVNKNSIAMGPSVQRVGDEGTFMNGDFVQGGTLTIAVSPNEPVQLILTNSMPPLVTDEVVPEPSTRALFGLLFVLAFLAKRAR